MIWLGRPAALAFPNYPFGSLGRLVGGGNYLVDVEAAFRRGDTATVRRKFSELRVARRSVPPGDLTLDALYPEAWLYAALGDDSAAAAWLDPTLDGLLATSPEVFSDPANAGALVQAMALRSELAARMGDTGTAARWASVVSVLWADADAFLQPRVSRLRNLTRGVPGVR